MNRARTMFKVLHVSPVISMIYFVFYTARLQCSSPVAVAQQQGLGCDMLQVGSTNDPSTSGDYDIIVKDLRELADEAAKQNPPIRM